MRQSLVATSLLKEVDDGSERNWRGAGGARIQHEEARGADQVIDVSRVRSVNGAAVRANDDIEPARHAAVQRVPLAAIEADVERNAGESVS